MTSTYRCIFRRAPPPGWRRHPGGPAQRVLLPLPPRPVARVPPSRTNKKDRGIHTAEFPPPRTAAAPAAVLHGAAGRGERPYQNKRPAVSPAAVAKTPRSARSRQEDEQDRFRNTS